MLVEINDEQRRGWFLSYSLEKLDSVILQFDPSHQVEAIKPKARRSAAACRA
jgi:hypothetical protein